MSSIFNSLLFAVNREDYLVESQIIEQIKATKILTIGSGGCVALNLKTIYPNLHVSAFDINPYQILHIDEKIGALKHSNYETLSVGRRNDLSLNQSGKFDKMFSDLRKGFIDYITSESEINHFFDANSSNDQRLSILDNWMKNKHIKKPFQDVFNDLSINKIFGDQATKHGQPGSYINYLKTKIMDGLYRRESHLNPFLQHIFLGYYMTKFAFPYLSSKGEQELELIEGNIFSIDNISSYDIVSLSNIFDWSDDESVRDHFQYLSKLKQGSAVIIRQLNNHKEWINVFGENFAEDKEFDRYWQIYDRSLFYDHIRLFKRK
tara:strand:- start:696 stop:1655 length:960 start_codon:yes stop_codon:yes gene_type:complete